MKIPPRLRIVSSYWDVETVTGDVSYHGKCDVDNYNIHLSAKLSKPFQGRTLFHELIHAFLSEYNVRLTDAQEEKVTRAIENGAAAFAKDHQTLFIEMVKNMGGK